MFNSETLLWDVKDYTEWGTYISNYLNISIKNIKTFCRSINLSLICECNKKDGRCMCAVGKIKYIMSSFDKTVYFNTIETRSYGDLVNKDIFKLLDSSMHELPLKNGTKINLKTLEITDRTDEDYFTFECDVDLLKSTQHADKYFSEIMPNKENREYLRKCLGYMLSGDTSARCFFVWYGNGNNGKSGIMTIMNIILKKLYLSCDKAVFVEPSYKSNGPSPHLNSLINKRIACYSEGETADDMDLNISVIKNISGEDEISARGLFKNPVEFTCLCKLSLLTNYVPPLTAESAIKHRLRYIFFNSEFVDKPEGTQKYKNTKFVDNIKTKYLSEVFSWIVKGAKEYYKDMKIEMTQEFKLKTDELLMGEDSIESFIKSFVIFTKDKKNYVRKLQLFEEYKKFCNMNSQRCQPRSTLYNRFEHLKIELSTLDGYGVYRCIKIKNVDDDDNVNDDFGIINVDNLVRKNKQLETEIIELKKEKELQPITYKINYSIIPQEHLKGISLNN
jgi:P4 family phage/plasmid primase-like protien